MYVLIPAYKPDMRLIGIVEEIHEKTDYAIVVVNDGSGAAFDEVFAALPDYCTLLSHEVNCGKGRAMKTGFAYIAGQAAADEGVVIVDADGQHLLPDVVRVCEEFAAHPQCMVIGSRRFTGKVPLRSRFGNTLTRHVFALASGVKLTDTQTGLRALPASALPEFCAIKGERYEYEMNMLLRAAELGIPMREVFIETVYIDDNSSSHFHVVRDSLKIYAVILKFAFSSIAAFLIDYALFNLLYYLLRGRMGPQMLLLVSTVGARIVSSLVNFTINKKVVFKSRGGTAAAFLKYYALAAVILAANYGLMSLLVTVLGLNASIAKILVEVTLFIVNYVVQRRFVFKNRAAK